MCAVSLFIPSLPPALSALWSMKQICAVSSTGLLSLGIAEAEMFSLPVPLWFPWEFLPQMSVCLLTWVHVELFCASLELCLFSYGDSVTGTQSSFPASVCNESHAAVCPKTLMCPCPYYRSSSFFWTLTFLFFFLYTFAPSFPLTFLCIKPCAHRDDYSARLLPAFFEMFFDVSLCSYPSDFHWRWAEWTCRSTPWH